VAFVEGTNVQRHATLVIDVTVIADVKTVAAARFIADMTNLARTTSITDLIIMK
jgi:hypothetical protein